MNLATLQFVAAGSLVVAWVWMLGKPLITDLWYRSRRDSVSGFRHQQALMGRLDDPMAGPWWWEARPRPIRAWRAQPRHRRRLQLLLASALAAFIAVLLAIALRGPYLRLAVLTSGLAIAHVVVASLIGGHELRRQEDLIRSRLQAEADSRRRMDEALSFGRPMMSERDEWEGEWDHADPFIDRGFESVAYDDDFYEPVPEMSFGPLGLEETDDLEHVDASDIIEHVDGDELVGLERSSVLEPGVETDPAPVDSEAPTGGRKILDEEPGEAVGARTDIDDGPATPDRPFAPSAVDRERVSRSRKTKARPIHIESSLDDEEGDKARAVND